MGRRQLQWTKKSILIFYKVVYWSAEKKTIICIDRQVIEDLDKQEGKSKYKKTSYDKNSE